MIYNDNQKGDKKMEKEKLSETILKIRAMKQYDQLTMAKEIGISLNTIVKIEKKRPSSSSPSHTELRKDPRRKKNNTGSFKSVPSTLRKS